MKFEKFENRILEIIVDTLEIQGLSGIITPISVASNRNRYFLILCRIKNKEKQCLFLRFEKWLFYIKGMSQMPKPYERRKYNFIKRKPIDKNKIGKRIQSEKEQINEANKLLHDIKQNADKASKIIRRRS